MCATFTVYVGNYVKVNIPNFDISELTDIIDRYFWTGTEHFQSTEYTLLFPHQSDKNGTYVSVNDAVWSKDIIIDRPSKGWLYTSEWFYLLDQLTINNISFSIEYGVIVSRT